jgi:hypothetical protein
MWKMYGGHERTVVSHSLITFSDKKHSMPLKMDVFQPVVLTLQFGLYFLIQS